MTIARQRRGASARLRTERDHRRKARITAFFSLFLSCAPLAGQGQNVDAEAASAEAAAQERAPGSSGPYDDRMGRGLVDFRDPFPLAKLHLQIPTATPPGLAPGRGAALVQFDWANSFSEQRTSLIDAETYTLRYGYWHALHRDFYVGVETAIEARDSGILDELIDGFHNAFAIGAARRASHPDNYRITLREDTGSLSDFDRGVGLGNTVLKAHWIFTEGKKWWPTVSVQALLSLPTSTSGFGGRSVDLGAALLAQKRVLDRLYLYGIVGGTYLPDRRTKGLRYMQFNYQVSAGIEFVPWWEPLSLVGQYVYYSPLLSDTARLDQPRQYFGAAVKYQVHPSAHLTLGMFENLPPLHVSADLALTLGFELRF